MISLVFLLRLLCLVSHFAIGIMDATMGRDIFSAPLTTEEHCRTKSRNPSC